MEPICKTEQINNNKVSIKELAEALNVSPAAVSLALSGKGNLSDESRKRIITFAKKMGYSPSLQAKTLRKNNIRIAVVLPSNPEYICNKFKNGIREAVNEFAGSKLECTVYEYETTNGDGYAALKEILDSDYDGVVLSLDDLSEELCYSDLYDKFNNSGKPIVTMGNKLKLFKACSAAWIDARKGGEIAADLFHLMGCTEVFLLMGSRFSSIHQRYANGFAAAARRYDIKISDVGYTADLQSSTTRATKERYPKNSGAGVFITTCHSWSVYDALKDMGITDVPIIGMDLLPETEEYLKSGKLTATICQHQTLQAKNAVEKLLEAILTDNGNAPMDDIVLEPYILTRGATFESVY